VSWRPSLIDGDGQFYDVDANQSGSLLGTGSSGGNAGRRIHQYHHHHHHDDIFKKSDDDLVAIP
jgi:hypothetical protein